MSKDQTSQEVRDAICRKLGENRLLNVDENEPIYVVREIVEEIRSSDADMVSVRQLENWASEMEQFLLEVDEDYLGMFASSYIQFSRILLDAIENSSGNEIYWAEMNLNAGIAYKKASTDPRKESKQMTQGKYIPGVPSDHSITYEVGRSADRAVHGLIRIVRDSSGKITGTGVIMRSEEVAGDNDKLKEIAAILNRD